mgnify:CR=1 FL=1
MSLNGTAHIVGAYEHPTRLALPKVPNDPERVAALPACGLVIRQPCRPDPVGAAAAPGAPTARRRRSRHKVNQASQPATSKAASASSAAS